ncbi:MAG TPA: GNAT family N-acetyltransferase [Nocardioides sp.]|nr:GNAT family N-acetyltransferase [Nocardioides sp.]
MRIRPMTVADVPVCAAISDDAFHAVDVANHRPGLPPPQRRTADHTARWIARTTTTVTTDPGGCVVAEEGGEVVGFATGFRREDVWCLATYAVRPALQGRGIGRQLLDTALAYAEPCPRWLLSASADPAACHRYRAAGFTLVPQSSFFGPVDRSALPAEHGVRAGVPADHTWIDELDRAIRGGSHAPDRAALEASGSLLVCTDRSGYAYASASGVALLAARSEASAALLLVRVLRDAADGFALHHVTEANPWARGLALAAGMTQAPRGHLGVRGMAAPAAYVHHGSLL